MRNSSRLIACQPSSPSHMLYKFLQHHIIHCCSLIFLSKYQASSCIGYQSWPSSTGCSAHCIRVLHAFLRYQHFCVTTLNIMDFLLSPGTFLLLSLGLKLWGFISNLRKVMFQNAVLPFIQHSANLPNMKYWLFSLKAFNCLGEPYSLFVLSLLFRMLQQCLSRTSSPKVNRKLFRYCSRTAYCQWPLFEIQTEALCTLHFPSTQPKSSNSGRWANFLVLARILSSATTFSALCIFSVIMQSFCEKPLCNMCSIAVAAI